MLKYPGKCLVNIGELLFLFRDQNGSTLDLSLPSKVCPESHKNSKTTCSIVFLRKAAIPHILGTTSVSAGGMGRPRLQLVALIVTSMCCTETTAWPGMARHGSTCHNASDESSLDRCSWTDKPSAIAASFHAHVRSFKWSAEMPWIPGCRNGKKFLWKVHWSCLRSYFCERCGPELCTGVLWIEMENNISILLKNYTASSSSCRFNMI